VTDAHDHALELARAAQQEGDQTRWLEQVYAGAAGDPAAVPWADLRPNRNLTGWLDRLDRHTGQALVVGCGLGDDAEELARRGYDVTAFDISPTAVEWARSRHAGSTVRYEVGDLLQPPAGWAGQFDLVVEIYTVQVLRGAARAQALRTLPAFVAPGGTLLVIARGRDEDDPEGDLPWPLTVRELASIPKLETVRIEDYVDEEGNRRLRAELARPSAG
jgi:SAM-dependent methyltransferase